VNSISNEQMDSFLGKLDGFELPPEWFPHAATWLSWPHNPDTWPKNILREVLPVYKEFIALLACDEIVCLNIQPNLGGAVYEELVLAGVNMSNIQLFEHQTNDSWCRDHGPDFLVNFNSNKKLVLDWGYNSWGGKYPPFSDDNLIPEKIAEALSLPRLGIDMVLEGGSFDVNGEGVLLTTESCLLNKNRNPRFSKKEIEKRLKYYLRQKEVVWLKQGIIGDDTDGHVDDIARFVSKDQILVGATHPNDENYSVLKANKSFLLENYKERFELIDLPMPSKLVVDGVLTPASYCNFYIANNKVIVPTFDDPNDKEALSILTECFPAKEVIGLNSSKIIYGLGSFHCLSKQEPII
jgi:agmatine deiminase